MPGNVFGPLRASIFITLQNRPWESLSLDVEGVDPDWVSSAATPLQTFLAEHESKIVKVLRNKWTKAAFGLAVWALFIPPIALAFQQIGIDRLVAVVAALVPLAAVNALYEWFTRPLIITNEAPSTWRELSRAAISAVAVIVIRFILEQLTRLIGLSSRGPKERRLDIQRSLLLLATKCGFRRMPTTGELTPNAR